MICACKLEIKEIQAIHKELEECVTSGELFHSLISALFFFINQLATKQKKSVSCAKITVQLSIIKKKH